MTGIAERGDARFFVSACPTGPIRASRPYGGQLNCRILDPQAPHREDRGRPFGAGSGLGKPSTPTAGRRRRRTRSINVRYPAQSHPGRFHRPPRRVLQGRRRSWKASVVKGTVVAIEKDLAVIDVGLKTEGRVPLKEFAAPGREADLKVGDEVEVYLERIENALGEAVLSREKARREESWVRSRRASTRTRRSPASSSTRSRAASPSISTAPSPSCRAARSTSARCATSPR